MNLIPLLANLFAMNFASETVLQVYEVLIQNINQSEDLSLLEVMHHYTSGMKAVFTQDTLDGMNLIRQSAGGAGFLSWSGIPNLI